MSSNRLRTMVRCVLKSSALSIVALSACEIPLALYTSEASAAEVAFRKIDFDIAAQTVESALLEFSKQADMQVMVGTNVVAGQKTKGVKGKRDVLTALEELLRGTGLKAEANGHTVTITAASDALVRPTTESALARGRFMWVSESSSINPTSSAARGVDSGPPSEKKIIDEIVVTGSQIRGLENNTVPITVLDKSYIESTGIGTATGLVESLPQNFARTNQSAVTPSGVSDSRQQGSSIDLRGLGEGTTLILINGHRLPLGYFGAAVDVSALPVTSLERVEILTDGASALYGSDAIGGVVNFVLRQQYDGAETRIRSGLSGSGGVNEQRFSQTFGTSWTGGGALVSGDYYKRDLLEAADRDFVPATAQIGSLLPEDKNYSGMFSVHQELSPKIRVYSDGLFTKRDSFNRGGVISLGERNYVDNKQGAAIVGSVWQLAESWTIEGSGSYGRNDLVVKQFNTTFTGTRAPPFIVDQNFKVYSGQVKIDGTLFSMPGGPVRTAFGVDRRKESIDYFTEFSNGSQRSGSSQQQTVNSAYAEVYFPLIGADMARPGAQRLELSLAARYDDYSSFGSSLDPRFGLMWEPIQNLRLRGSYGTSYKAPGLVDYPLAFNSAVARFRPDPGVPSGTSYQLIVSGTAGRDLTAQTAKTFSFGADYQPLEIEGLTIGANYYSINYEDRIATPPGLAVILGNPASFGDLIVRNPNAADVNRFIGYGNGQFFAFNADFSTNVGFSPSQVNVIIDARRRNLSSTKTSGIDFNFGYNFAAFGGQANASLNATHIFKLSQRLTDTSASLETAGTYSNPADLRLRGAFQWSSSSLQAGAFVNYWGSYEDNRVIPARGIEDYLTIDARVGVIFDAVDITVSLSAQNVFDQDPPKTAILDSTRDSGFDPFNANPMGRFFALELTKRW